MTGVRHLFGAAEAERILGIPAATIRSWARRRRIYPYGLDERGRPLFDRDDLLAMRGRTRTCDQHAKATRRARRVSAGHGLPR